MGVNTRRWQCHLGQGLECSGSPSMLTVQSEGRETASQHPLRVSTYELSPTQVMARPQHPATG